jgi:acetyltransferase-like isoleucine patch superfamily enzyme
MFFDLNFILLKIKIKIKKSLEIGDFVVIKRFTALSGKVKVGSYCKLINCKISGPVVLSEYVSIADNTLIKGKFDRRVQIGFGTIIGPNCIISCDYHFRHEGVINDLLLLQVLGDAYDSKKKNVCNDINIGKHVWIGCNVYIRPGVTIGDFATIGANSVVTKNVNSYEVYK